jgi:hypothetical protein
MKHKENADITGDLIEDIVANNFVIVAKPTSAETSPEQKCHRSKINFAGNITKDVVATNFFYCSKTSDR